MSRCKICDFSPDTRSEFYTGLSLNHRPNTYLKRDPRGDGFLCSSCFSAIGDDLKETESDDNVGFNTPALSLWDKL